MHLSLQTSGTLGKPTAKEGAPQYPGVNRPIRTPTNSLCTVRHSQQLNLWGCGAGGQHLLGRSAGLQQAATWKPLLATRPLHYYSSTSMGPAALPVILQATVAKPLRISCSRALRLHKRSGHPLAQANHEQPLLPGNKGLSDQSPSLYRPAKQVLYCCTWPGRPPHPPTTLVPPVSLPSTDTLDIQNCWFTAA